MTSYKKLILKNTLTICILFSLFFIVSFYIERYYSSRREYLSKTQQDITSITNVFESASFQVQDLPVMFRSNPDFKSYVESPSPTPYLNNSITRYIRDTIASISDFNSFVAVTRPDDEWVNSVKMSAPFDYFLREYGLPKDEIDKTIQEFKAASGLFSHIHTFFSSSKDKRYFTVLVTDNYSFSKPYFLFVVYDLDKILAELDPDAAILISHDGNPLYASDVLSEEDVSKLLDGKSIFRYSTIANSTHNFSSFGELTFTVVLPKMKYLSGVNHHIFITLLVLPILFLLSLFISQKVSEKTYSPIQRLVNQIDSIDTHTLENEIEAISSAISILSRRNNTLSDMVANSRSELKEKFLNDLLHGYLTDEQIAYGIKSYLKDTEAMTPLAVIITESNLEAAELALSDDGNASSLTLVISSIFAEEFKNESFYHFTALSPTSYCTVISCKDMDALKDKLQKLLLTVESELGFNMYSSVSNSVDSFEELPGAFLSTYFAHTNLKAREISRTVYSRDEINVPILYSYAIDNDIYTYCLRREREKLQKSLDFLVKENFTTEKVFAERQSYISVLIFALCTRILASIEADSEAVFGKNYNIYLELRACRTTDEYRRLLSYLFWQIMDYLEASQSKYEHNYADAMLNYINENYASDISLLDMAKYMNMSQSYVSRLFKRLLHSNFKDYLARVRVEQAEKLLCENPDKPISEIASMVGFNSVKSFTTVFSRLVNMTPSEYRRINKK